MPTELILSRAKVKLLQFILDNNGMDVAMTQPRRGQDEPELHSMLPGCNYAYENRAMKEDVLDDLEEDSLVFPVVVARYGTEGYCVVRYTLTPKGEAALRRHNGKRSSRDRTAD